tara:strand:- start:1403 stop:4309 length:2907 start_codon:yes stop_codon:yes gene_type:complete
MSVQLSLYPQQYDGTFNSITVNATNMCADAEFGFTWLNAVNNYTTVSSATTWFNMPLKMAQDLNLTASPMPMNEWLVGARLASDMFTGIVGSDRVLYLGQATVTSTLGEACLIQRITGLTVGAQYRSEAFFSIDGGTAEVSHSIIDSANGLNAPVLNQVTTYANGQHSDAKLFTAPSDEVIIGISFKPASGATSNTIQFDTNVSYTGQQYVWNVSLEQQSGSGAINQLADGQVIVDLYEDENIPLTLSIDDFTNVAEKVQSYSKAFKLPGTKRNNLIFDNIFEITRTAQKSLLFNPYRRTQCCLKENGIILFEGYLRLIDVQDKEDERSYNVNLYSDNIALADVLKDREFKDIGFEELEHLYDKSNIKRSWNDNAAAGSAIAWTNTNISGFRTDYQTLKYPFVDWNHQFKIADGSDGTNAEVGMPQLNTLAEAFRPWISLHYLVNRIFDATDFTYSSEFFESDDFKNMYMDFNWGSDVTPGSYGFFGYRKTRDITGVTGNYLLSASYLKLPPTPQTGTGISQIGNSYPIELGHSATDFLAGTGSMWTAQYDNQLYRVNWRYAFKQVSGTPTVEYRWIHENAAGVTTTIIPGQNGSSTFSSYMGASGDFEIYLPIGDKIYCQAKCSAGSARVYEARVWINTVTATTTNDSLLGSIRGDLKQWDFLKGLINMFNLVTIPDPDNKNVIKIEPYPTIFNQDIVDPSSAIGTELKDRIIQHNWTDKIDVSQIVLKPLTDLNKFTIFKYEEESDDYMFNNYKHAVNGYLYGSKLHDASGFDTLTGKDEIIASPFAATIMKPLMTEYEELIVPTMYALDEDGATSGIENMPRICYNNGLIDLTSSGITYYIPQQNGGASANEDSYLRFSHLSQLPVTGTPTSGTVRDLNYAAIQLVVPGVTAPIDNLYNMYWAPYYNELYNSDTRTMTIKVDLNSSDIASFQFSDRVFIKNRAFRVNKIDYKPGDLSTVEFILIP